MLTNQNLEVATLQIITTLLVEYFEKVYPWISILFMIHKILVHEKQILKHCILFPGHLGEILIGRKRNLKDVLNRDMEGICVR